MWSPTSKRFMYGARAAFYDIFWAENHAFSEQRSIGNFLRNIVHVKMPFVNLFIVFNCVFFIFWLYFLCHYHFMMNKDVYNNKPFICVTTGRVLLLVLGSACCSLSKHRIYHSACHHHHHQQQQQSAANSVKITWLFNRQSVATGRQSCQRLELGS